MILNCVCFALLPKILLKSKNIILTFMFWLLRSASQNPPKIKSKSSQNRSKIIPKISQNPSKTTPRGGPSRDLQKSMIFVRFLAPLVPLLGGSGGILGAKSRPSWRPKSIKIDAEIYIKSKVI